MHGAARPPHHPLPGPGDAQQWCAAAAPKHGCRGRAHPAGGGPARLLEGQRRHHRAPPPVLVHQLLRVREVQG
eukprot:SM008081S22906  [mRNA]  locus=s8081:50:462:+ [translate_table: standard]